MNPVSSISPAELTSARKAALTALSLADFHRIRSGFRGRGRTITIDTAAWLRGKGLARVVIDGHHKLTITDAGRLVLAVLEERKQA